MSEDDGAASLTRRIQVDMYKVDDRGRRMFSRKRRNCVDECLHRWFAFENAAAVPAGHRLDREALWEL
jgi:hypothetical protein